MIYYNVLFRKSNFAGDCKILCNGDFYYADGDIQNIFGNLTVLVFCVVAYLCRICSTNLPSDSGLIVDVFKVVKVLNRAFNCTARNCLTTTCWTLKPLWN